MVAALVTGNPEEALNWHRLLGTLHVMLALVGCVQAVDGPGEAPYAPYSHDDSDMRNGPDGGGGGSM